MTDFTDSSFASWNDHGSLRKYIDEGRVDFAVFDAAG